MEDIEAVKLGLKSKNIQQQIASISQLIKYGETELELVIQALKDESWLLQHTAFLLLRQKSLRKIPKVKKALKEYMIVDGEYPDDHPEVLNFLSKSPISVTNESGNLVPNPALLPLMKWGEVIIDDERAMGDRDLGVYSYIVDERRGQKVWSNLECVDDGNGIEIDLKFLEKKGYSYYLKDLTFLLELGYYSWLCFPTFTQQETLIFDNYYGWSSPDNENVKGCLKFYSNNKFAEGSIGELIEEKGNWFIVSSEGEFLKLARIKNFDRIPQKYLRLRGYLYYRSISHAHQLPIIGYLSPKEYLDFLNIQILDFLSWQPIWSCGVATSWGEMWR